MTDIEKLKTAALAATRGERELWEEKPRGKSGLYEIAVAIPSEMLTLCYVVGSSTPMHENYIGIRRYKKDAEFIAAANPAAVLELISALEGYKIGARAEAEAADEARAEVRKLKAECEVLRKNAERYQWLRKTDCWEDEVYKTPWKERPDFLWIASSREEVTNNDGEKLDAAIDFLIAKEKVDP